MKSRIPANRRGFMSHVGRGMLAAGLGKSLANDLGFSAAFAEEGPEMIPMGEHVRLVELMRSTPAEKLQPVLAKKVLKGEADLQHLVAAGGLASAYGYNREDEDGFRAAGYEEAWRLLGVDV